MKTPATQSGTRCGIVGFLRSPSFWAALFILLAGTPVPADSGELRFDRVGDRTALADAVVTAILQDRRGFLWFGTYETGLFRFDGYRITRFAPNPRDPATLASNRIWALAEDRDGFLWVGTWGNGLCRFDPALERFERFRHDDADPESLSDDIVTTLFVDSAGTLWAGTWGGLNRIDRTEGGGFRFTRFRHEPGNPGSLSHDKIWAIVEARGVLMVGLRYGGVCSVPVQDTRSTPVTFRRIGNNPDDPSSLSGDDVWSLASAPDGGVWAGTQKNGLNRIDPSTGRCERFASAAIGLKTEQIRNLLVDSRGHVWIGARFQGLVRLDPKSGTTTEYAQDAADPASLSHNQVVSMFEDREGIMWFGTWGGGVNKLDPAAGRFGLHRHHDADPRSLVSDLVTAICQDSTGTLWVGTDKGLNRRLPGTGPGFERITVASPVPGPHPGGWINCIYEDRDGTLWVGLRDGPLFTLPSSAKQSSNPRFAMPFATPAHPIHDLKGPAMMLQDRNGDYWFSAGADGVIWWDGASAVKFRYDPGNPSSIGEGTIHTIFEDSTGTLWFATREGGLCRFDRATQTFERFAHRDDDPHGISGNTVIAIAEDSRGDLWIGTLDSGLNLLDRQTSRFTHFREADGLASDSIAGILVDGRNRLWLGTSRGIDVFDPATREIVHYDERDGLQSDNFTITNCHPFKGPGGLFHFGGTKGCNVFDPAQIHLPSEPPPVVLTDFLLLNRPVPIGGDGPVTRAVGLLDEILLDHSDYLFGFEFAALSYREPGKNRYRYMLEGYDKDWIVANASDRKAVFTGIPPGTYTFRVQAANGDGEWSTPGSAIRVRVNPPWWRTWWAYAAYAVGTLGLVFGGVHLRVRTLERRSAELEVLVTHRTAELAASESEARKAHEEAIEASQAKSVFLANMSHELRTPLNAVIGFAQVLERRGAMEGEDRESLQIIQRSGEHLLGLINDVLSISKIEAGKLSLVAEPFDLGLLLQAVESIVRVRAEAKGLEVVFTLEPAPPRAVTGDEGKLRQVLINLLGNAVKFTNSGRVTLRARWSDAMAAFDVEDTGHGISEEDLGKLFDAFSQTESGQKSKEGTGLGLVISRQIVRLMGGDIRVQSRLGEGTVFSFEASLPLAAEALEARERRRVIGLAPDQSTPRILVVDDTEENRLLLVRLLTSTGFEVREAVNGQQAIEQWERWRPDLIFMDMRMPVMDGRAATRWIRERESLARPENPDQAVIADAARGHCRIVALTASAFEHEREGILATGTDDFVTKPFRVETIFEVISEHTGVRYRYERADSPSPPASVADENALTPERLGALPREWLRELYKVLSIGDIDEAAAVAGRIEVADEALGRILQAQIRAYRIDELLSRLEAFDSVP